MASIRASGAQPWYKDRYKTVRRVAVPQNAMMMIHCKLAFLVHMYCCTATRHMPGVIALYHGCAPLARMLAMA